MVSLARGLLDARKVYTPPHEQAGAVGWHTDSCASLAELGGGVQNGDLVAVVSERQRRTETSEASTDCA